jgi:hypothetical protein
VPEGVYTVTATFTPTDLDCATSNDQATLTVGSAGSKATGGGWTTLTGGGGGRVNFGFVVDLVPGTGPGTSNPAQYKGQFVLVSPDRWRFKGTFGQAYGGTYVVVTNSSTSKSGSGSGGGNVQYWNGLTWAAGSGGTGVPFTISFTDNGSGGKQQTTPDQFGFKATYDAVGNGYDVLTYGVFPNFLPQAIKGGNITIS